MLRSKDPLLRRKWQESLPLETAASKLENWAYNQEGLIFQATFLHPEFRGLCYFIVMFIPENSKNLVNFRISRE